MSSGKKDFFHVFRVIISILGIIVLILACIAGYLFGKAIFSDEPMTYTREDHIEYTLTVKEGDSVLKVGKQLENQGIISSAIVFYAQSKVFDCRISPGVYIVNSKNSSRDILKYLDQEYEKASEGTD